MTGRVVSLQIAAGAGAPMRIVRDVRAHAGQGLAGDRYRDGTGHYSDRPAPDGARQLTLIQAEVIEAVAIEIGAELDTAETRRNVTTRGVDLNALVGRRFTVGEVVCEGVRLCEPCVYLEGLLGKRVNRPLVHRGGLRARIVHGGVIRTGDAVVAAPDAGGIAG